MPRAREYATSPHARSVEDEQGSRISQGGMQNRTGRGTVGHGETRPATAMAALMECAPGEEPEPSLEELWPLREAIALAIEGLDEREQWVITALWSGGYSERELAAELSIPRWTIRDVRDRARAKLQVALGADPTVKEYLER